ncbi:ATP-binding cassette domain-containing protein [[Clostridium] innocuum]|uniref:ABC transporter ATP-binding protein n=1 Tax=Clostridium innocuum TaxID=1522 RepID=UPI001F5A53AB|nr:ATP-binding cassette domain-containing protein [[Clostridium] innocuum]MCI2977037.1 ATP-binding cassette domain-containing protein [[Clostridium] innocuum]MCR0190524.1 ATP-binding cassette domain-containing protein [[Clostridium] innocuum]
MELQVHDLHKSFDGREVLHGISFSISSGKALGLLGRNGAGKSTTIRILMDVFKADQGNMSMNGKTFHAKDYNIGYLPEERGLYPKKKVSKQLIYLATLRGLSHGEAKANLKKWLKRLGIEEYENRVLDTLSKGNQQKVQLAQTLMCDPDIVILDEPFSGLDPVNSQTLKEVVQEQIQDGKLVIFSSHQMNYVEEFCEDIVILHHGDVVLQGNLKQIKKEYGKNRIVIRALYPKKQEFRELLETQCQELLHIYEEKDGGFIIELQPNVNKRDVLTRMLELEVDLEAFQLYEASLTDIFVSKAGDEE